MSTITRTLSLNTEKHADIISWLDRQDNVSEAVRNACRKAARGDATLNDVLDAIERLERRGVAVVASAPDDNGDEPELAALALDRLGV